MLVVVEDACSNAIHRTLSKMNGAPGWQRRLHASEVDPRVKGSQRLDLWAMIVGIPSLADGGPTTHTEEGLLAGGRPGRSTSVLAVSVIR